MQKSLILKFHVLSMLVILPFEVLAESEIVVEEIEVPYSEDEIFSIGKKVDVDWNFIQHGRKHKSAPLIKFAEITAVGTPYKDLTKDAEESMVKISLSITQRQNQFLKVAKETGNLSLHASNLIDQKAEDTLEVPEIIDLGPVGGGVKEEKEIACDFGDPNKPSKYKYKLEKGKWVIDKSQKSD